MLLYRTAIALVFLTLSIDARAQDFATAARDEFLKPSRFAVPSGHEPGFRLKVDFPTAAPPAETYPWSAYSFKTQPREYMRAVLDYALEGNAAVDWRIHENTVRPWYHAPWMHYDDRNGREPVRGLTSERRSQPQELHLDQTSSAANWAVSIYNAPGGYTFGRVWADPATPNTRDMTFPVGTVAIKLLFTTASTTQVPYLTGSKEWQAQIVRNQAPRTLRLLQVDIGVRDANADSTTGWVFGTFMYHADEPGAAPYGKLRPVGLMWGNDERLAAGQPAVEGWINPEVQSFFAGLPRVTLGFRGRVNGPVDNPASACLACHGRAMDLGFTGRTVPFAPPADANEDEIHQFFRNLKPNEPFFAGFRSLDYSLQLAVGIASFRDWVEENHPSEIPRLDPYPTPPVAAAIPGVLPQQPTSARATGRSLSSFARGEP